MKTVDETTQTEKEVSFPEREVKGVLPRGSNREDTDTGDPLANELPRAPIHHGRDHVTGKGKGPLTRSHRRQNSSLEAMSQLMVRMAKVAGETMPSAAGDKTWLEKTPQAPQQSQSALATIAKDPWPGVDWTAAGGQHAQMHHNPAWGWGEFLRNTYLNNPVSRFVSQGAVPGGLVGLGVGAGLGLLAPWLYNRFVAKRRRDETSVPMWGLIGALGGMGVGALSGNWRRTHSTHGPGNPYYPFRFLNQEQQRRDWDANIQKAMAGEGKVGQASVKQAAAYSIYDVPTDAKSELLQDLARAGLPGDLLQRFIVGIKNLNEPQAQQLRAMVGGLSGMALATVVARFLGLGFLPTIGLALAGGLYGSNMYGMMHSGRPKHQVLTDMYGRPYPEY